MPAPAVAAALKAAGAALGKAAARGAAGSAAKRSRKGGGLFVLLAVAAALILVVFGAPAFALGAALLVTTAAGDEGWSDDDDADPEDPSLPGEWNAQQWSIVPACVTLRDVSDVDGTTTNGTWNASQLGHVREIIEAALTQDLPQQRGTTSLVRLPAEGESWPTAGEPTVRYGEIEAALVAAMEDADLKVSSPLPGGDGTSRGGAFHNAVDSDWGTRAQVMDVEFSTGTFLRRLDLGVMLAMPTTEPWVAIRKAQTTWAEFDDDDVDNSGSQYEKWWHDGDGGQLLSAFLDGSACATLPTGTPYDMTSGFGARNLDIPGASRWHPAWDFDPGGCGRPVYAARPGTVTMLGGGAANNLGITDPETGAQLEYLHTPPGGELVSLGETVAVGQHIANIGDYGVGGCHLDLRIYAPRVPGESRMTDELTHTEDVTTETYAGYVHPAHYLNLFGVDLCDPTVCTALDDTGIKN